MSIPDAVMKPFPQVDKRHYDFGGYVSKPRWGSLWHQLDEIMRLRPSNVLEIGPGNGLLKVCAGVFGLPLDTMDHDPVLSPDCVAEIGALPFAAASYDLVCAFQVLEHLPYARALDAFTEMVRVSRHHVVISLPDSRGVWIYRLHIPLWGPWTFLLPKPRLRAQAHVFDGQHHWELNAKGYPLSRVIEDLSRNVRLLNTYPVPENPRHRFFVFEK